jgi:hypothetical protein
MGGVFNLVNLNTYHYSGNNPVKYTDPDGNWLFLAGITGTGGAGIGGTVEAGIAVSKDPNNGTFQVGTYTTSGTGFYGGASGSGTVSITYSHQSKKINDINGLALLIGGTLGEGITGGIDVIIPLTGLKENFAVTGNLGGGGGVPGEGHALITDTTTDIYGEGNTFEEAWKQANEAGMFDDLPKKVLDHFKENYNKVIGEDYF